MLLLGFILFAVLVLGAALCILALLLLGAALGVQLLALILSAASASVLANTVGALQLLAAAAFAFGLALAIVGALSLLFPGVQAFLAGLRLILRVAMHGLMITGLSGFLRTAATALDIGGEALAGPRGGPVDGSVADGFTQAGQKLIDASGAVPKILTVARDRTPLGGLVALLPDVANVDVVTDVVTAEAENLSLVSALDDAGDFVQELGTGASDTGRALQDGADALREIAGLIDQVTQ